MKGSLIFHGIVLAMCIYPFLSMTITPKEEAITIQLTQLAEKPKAKPVPKPKPKPLTPTPKPISESTESAKPKPAPKPAPTPKPTPKPDPKPAPSPKPKPVVTAPTPTPPAPPAETKPSTPTPPATGSTDTPAPPSKPASTKPSDAPSTAPATASAGTSSNGTATGNAEGEDEVGYGPFGRQVTYRPDIKSLTKESGKIRVELCIDREGKVLSTKHIEAGSTIDDPKQIKNALVMGKKYRFEKDYTAPKKHCGYLTFVFTID